MESRGYGERMCDSCENKSVGLVLDVVIPTPHAEKCLANNIIPSGIDVTLFKLIRAKRDEGEVIGLDVLGIAVVLCRECCLKNRDEVLAAIAEKPRILQEAIKSHQIWIEDIIQGISEKEGERKVLVEKIKKVVAGIRSDNEFLAGMQKSKTELEYYLRKNKTQ